MYLSSPVRVGTTCIVEGRGDVGVRVNWLHAKVVVVLSWEPPGVDWTGGIVFWSTAAQTRDWLMSRNSADSSPSTTITIHQLQSSITLPFRYQQSDCTVQSMFLHHASIYPLLLLFWTLKKINTMDQLVATMHIHISPRILRRSVRPAIRREPELSHKMYHPTPQLLRAEVGLMDWNMNLLSLMPCFDLKVLSNTYHSLYTLNFECSCASSTRNA